LESRRKQKKKEKKKPRPGSLKKKAFKNKFGNYYK
jgi:hypothetical protein